MTWQTLILGLVLIGALATTVTAADSLVWLQSENRVDANLDAADLQTVLSKVSRATGWQIYLEPDIRRIVSVKFKNVAPGDALRRLLNDLNFALLPQTNGHSKLLIYRTSLQEATQLIPAAVDSKPASKSRAISNELIVSLKPDSKQKIDDLARRLGAKVIGSIDGLNAYRLQFADEAAANSAREILAADTSLGSVESNFGINPPTQTEKLQVSSSPPFTLRPKPATDDGKVIIGLIDMAVQPLSGGMKDFLLPEVQVAGAPGHLGDQLSHGTSMAETILRGLSVASQESGGSSVRILPVDVYGQNEQTTSFDVAKGVYTAVNAGASVINLSMAGDGESKLLSNLIQQSYNSGVLFFGAAGNEPTTAPNYPAAYPEVVAVTAGDKKGNLAPYANRGSFVDVIAPGLSVVNYAGDSFLVSGTSASTAYMSGTAAAYRASGKQPSQTEAMIRSNFGVARGGK